MSLLKKNKLIILTTILFIITAFAIFKYSLQAPKKIELKEVNYKGSALGFFSKIQENAVKWQDKVIIIKGNITNIDDKGVTLENKIYCQLRQIKNKTKLNTNQSITLKGRVIGYDDLLEELKLDQCIIQH